MAYYFYIFFGLAPGIIWLFYFLRKDVHPEPKTKILKVFSFGTFATLPAFFIEKGGQNFLQSLQIPGAKFAYFFLAVAFPEEILKYLVVRKVILLDPEFDEPIDSMLYMIISALGFASLENILFLFGLKSSLLLETLVVSSFRFLGATFLHALCSGLTGFFLALSFFKTKNRKELTILGLGISSILHGLYNFSIMEVPGNQRFIVPIIILMSSAVFVFRGFKKLCLFSKN